MVHVPTARDIWFHQKRLVKLYQTWGADFEKHSYERNDKPEKYLCS
jgi:hypothetical protein